MAVSSHRCTFCLWHVEPGKGRDDVEMRAFVRVDQHHVCPPVAVGHLDFAGDVNFEELARSCDDFNGAQLKAVCVEAGMLALRREAEQVRIHLLRNCCEAVQ